MTPAHEGAGFRLWFRLRFRLWFLRRLRLRPATAGPVTDPERSRSLASHVREAEVT